MHNNETHTMNHRPQPAIEIPPSHWITVPVFAKPNERPPQEVLKANKEAEQKINAAKDDFIAECMNAIKNDEFSVEDITITLRDNFSPTIVIPTHHSPEQAKQTGLLRQTSHTLTVNHQSHWLGTMDIEYKHDGAIEIKVSIA